MLITIGIVCCGCISENTDDICQTKTSVRISFGYPSDHTKSETDEIQDISLLVFDHTGLAEKCLWFDHDASEINLDLIQGNTYSFYACVNFGYQVSADNISQLQRLSFQLKDVQSLSETIPACGVAANVTITKDMNFSITVERLCSRINVTMDKSRLSDDVNLKVTGIRICKTPQEVPVFCYNGDFIVPLLLEGFSLNEEEADILNRLDQEGIGDKVCLYMLEDIMGDSYLEIEMDYLSYTYFNHGGPLIYRTYIGEDGQNHGVKRNSRYNITIQPEADGLSEDNWKVDKTYLQEFGPSRFASFPESYQQGEIGDTLHLWCELYPPHAPFDVGLDYLEEDRANGIYDYIIDEDGHGVRLILKKPGVGLVYMEAGAPVNEAAMWFIVVNLPRDT